MIIKMGKKIIQETVIALFFIVFFLSYIKILPFQVCNFYYALALLFFIMHSMRRINKKVLMLCITAVACGTVSGIYTDVLEISVYFKTVTYILIGYYYSRDGMGEFYHKLIFWFYEIVLAYFVFVSRSDLNMVFSTLSRNYISVFSMIATIIFYLGEEENNSELKLYPCAINFIICVGAIGRGGILASGFLLLCVIYLKYFKHRKALLILCISFILFIVIATLPALEQSLGIFQRFFYNGLRSEGRIAIIKEYLERILLNPLELFLGGKIKNCPIILHFNINFHNTFLQMHFTYGIIFSLAVIWLSIKACKNFWENGKQFLIMLFLSFVIRSLLDQVGYAFFGEVFIYFFIFKGIYRLQKLERGIFGSSLKVGDRY